MARPKKKDEDRRDFGIKIRLNSDEMENLNDLSNRLGLSRSETVRVLILESLIILNQRIKNA